jgi:hypothetical protein
LARDVSALLRDVERGYGAPFDVQKIEALAPRQIERREGIVRGDERPELRVLANVERLERPQWAIFNTSSAGNPVTSSEPMRVPHVRQVAEARDR